MLEQLLSRWSALSARDRRILSIGAVFLVLVLVWMLLFQPAWNGRRKLADELPRLRGELAQMERMSEEVKEVSQAAKAPLDPPEALKTSLRRSLEQANLMGSVSRLEIDGDFIEIVFQPVDFESWTDWIDSALRETRLRVADLTLQRETPGLASGRLRLDLPKPQGDRR